MADANRQLYFVDYMKQFSINISKVNLVLSQQFIFFNSINYSNNSNNPYKIII